MNSIRSLCLFVVVALVVVNVLGVNEISHGSEDGTAALKVDKEEGRFLDGLDGILSDITKGINFKVSQSHIQGSSSSYVKQVTQSHHTVNGQTVSKTEIKEFTESNPVGPGLRFKRDLFEDLVENVGEKAKVVKNKLAGAVADGVNIAHNGMYSVQKAINQRLRE